MQLVGGQLLGEVIAEITDHAALREWIGGQRRMFLAHINDAVVGFSATRAVNDDTTELAGIVVLEGMHGLGLGTALLEAATQSAAAAGSQHISVKTEATNEGALGFYRGNGFTDTRRVVEDVEGQPMELMEMMLSL